jgi:hypothetical protein
MIKGKCDICGEPITPAKNQSQFNRNFGLHRLRRHNIASPKAAESKMYREHAKARKEAEVSVGFEQSNESNGTKTQVAPKRYKRRHIPNLKEAETTKFGVVENSSATTQVVPARLSECPHCGTRFYMAKDPTVHS